MLRTSLVAVLILLFSMPAHAQEPYEGETLISLMDATHTQLIAMDGSVLMAWHGAARPA